MRAKVLHATALRGRTAWPGIVTLAPSAEFRGSLQAKALSGPRHSERSQLQTSRYSTFPSLRLAQGSYCAAPLQRNTRAILVLLSGNFRYTEKVTNEVVRFANTFGHNSVTYEKHIGR